MLLGVVAFLTGLVFWPGIPGAALSPRWAVLAVLLPFCLHRVRLSAGHFFGLAFLGYAVLSILWSSVPLDSFNSLFHLLIVAMAFWTGSAADNLKPTVIGLGLGLSVSSAFAIAQLFFGYQGIHQVGVPAGLFINPIAMAQAAALVLVAALGLRLWRTAVMVAPAALLPMQRGALLAIVVGLAVTWMLRARDRLFAVLTVSLGSLAALFAVTLWRPETISARFALWLDTIDGMTVFGHGLGSWYALYPLYASRTDTLQLRERHAHNDFIEWAFDTGIGAGILAAVLVCCFVRAGSSVHRGVLAAFLCMACFGFPFHDPVTVFFGALVAGHLCGARARVFSADAHSRSDLRAREADPGYCLDRPSLGGVSVQQSSATASGGVADTIQRGAAHSAASA